MILPPTGVRMFGGALALSWLLGAPAVADGTRQLNLPDKPYRYAQVDLPEHVRSVAHHFDNTPKTNPITNAGATLGRVLFYDTKLSKNGTTACASCHQQEHAFSDARKKSLGFAGKQVPRNSMSLVNVRYYPSGKMFWDERANTLEEQVLMPIENEVEMGHRLPLVVKQLAADPLYRPLFQAAFGDSHVTEQRIGRALAQFVRALVSFDSKYDRGRAQVEDVLDPFPNFTKQENYGKEQFFGRARCASCHLEPYPARDQEGNTTGPRQSAFFVLTTAVVNGIDSDDPGKDWGLGAVTKRKRDRGKFKVSSLRNIERTGPFMHDGRFHTLDQVVEQYNWSVSPHPNLDPRLADFVNGLALPEVEKVALTEFLRTLTDETFLRDPKFSDPFRRAKPLVAPVTKSR